MPSKTTVLLKSDFSEITTPDLCALSSGMVAVLKVLKRDTDSLAEFGLPSARVFGQQTIARYQRLMERLTGEINTREDFLPR